MKAIILAAGRGERMRPLTDSCPKPLLKVNGTPLIEHHIRRLAQAGIIDIVINHAWLGKQIEEYCGDGSQWHVSIRYSAETSGALETAGGIIKALPLLGGKDGDEPFLVVNGDVFCSFDFNTLPTLANHCVAHLCLVENPEHNVKGDFYLHDGLLANAANRPNDKTYTYSGIAVFSAAFFKDLEHNFDHSNNSEQVMKLAPLIRKHAEQGSVSAEVFQGQWTDVGTPARLAQLNE